MITALLVVAVAAIVGFGVALTVRSKRDFAAQNEVVPGTPSSAPASWAGSHSREAKLHRRLGDAVRSVRAHPRISELGLESQLHAVDARAVELDERLVAAATLPEAHRGAALDTVETDVVEFEAAVAELVTGVVDSASRDRLDAAIASADERLTALAEARAEVERLDGQGIERLDGQGVERIDDQRGGTADGSTSSS